jgi:hypothetical protein
LLHAEIILSNELSRRHYPPLEVPDQFVLFTDLLGFKRLVLDHRVPLWENLDFRSRPLRRLTLSLVAGTGNQLVRMPTVLRSGPYRVYFLSHEPNEPAATNPYINRGASDALPGGLEWAHWHSALTREFATSASRKIRSPWT